MSKIEQEKYDVNLVEDFKEQKSDKTIYTIIKVVDNYEKKGSCHPNGIDNGYSVTGTFKKPPTIGERFLIRGRGFRELLDTSPVTEIVSDTIFKTKNSTYKLVEADTNN